jgi:hypothetical protein
VIAVKLTSFEEYIDDIIIGRGKDYFLNGRVENAMLVDHGHYSALVSGSEDYQVNVSFNDQGEIIESTCDCPYDYGNFCKHQVAVFYTLNNEEPKPKKNVNKKEKIKDILEGLKKEELVKVILTITEDAPHIEKQLMMKYGPANDEVEASGKLIKEYINSAKVRGFIDWNKTSQAVKGADIVLEKAVIHMENGHPKMTVLLALVTLPEMVDMIQYCDDSSGYVGDIIHASLTIITDAAEGGSHLSPSDQKEVFQKLLIEVRQPRYQGWSEWKQSLLNACIPFCHDSELRKTLETELQMMIEHITEDSWSANYEKEQLMLLQLGIMEQFYNEEAVDEFIFNNIHLEQFRVTAISKLFERRKYESIVDLCLEGEQKDAGYPGTVRKWKEFRYQAYEYLGDIDNQRELGKSLLLQGDYSYFHKLKGLYLLREWVDELNDILIIFEECGQSETYVKILIEEKLTEKLLTYCKENIYQIERLYPHLIEQYPSDVAKLFTDYIRHISQGSSNRKDYKKVCRVIKTYKKVCGIELAIQLINELQQIYVRRPAFMDELRKMK